tara:strand:- start:1469 stop:1711 length:243 start_codon:yes stop_codon:yes gene_type:complete
MAGKIHKHITDLGIAAYLVMHGYDVVGKRGKAIYFAIENDPEELEKFEKLTMEYLSSSFHRFDACLMSLKKTPEYMPSKI